MEHNRTTFFRWCSWSIGQSETSRFATMRAMTRRLVAVLVVAACGGGKSAPPVTPPPQQPAPVSPELNDALAPVAWLVGDWHATRGALRRHWVAAGGTLYAVAFDGPDWSLQIVDDGDGTSDTADGALRLIDHGAGFFEVEM